MPEITKIIDLAELFGVTTDYLLKEDDESTDSDLSDFSDNSASDEELQRALTADEVSRFLIHKKNEAKKFALGVFLCVFPPVVLFAMLGLWIADVVTKTVAVIIGVPVMVVGIAIGVILLVAKTMGVNSRGFYYISDGNICTKGEIRYKICELKTKSEVTMSKRIAIASALFIIALIPLICVFVINQDFYLWLNFGMMFGLSLVAPGVTMIVDSVVYDDGINVLLMNKEEKIRDRAIKNKVYNAAPPYWIAVTSVYLLVSFFVGYLWALTWVIWPFAGAIYPGFRRLVALYWKNKLFQPKKIDRTVEKSEQINN